MRWIWFYLNHRRKLASFKLIGLIQRQNIYMKILLAALLIFVLSLTGCTRYHYVSEDAITYPCIENTVKTTCIVRTKCEVKITSWSDLSAGSADIIDCDITGNIAGRDNENLKKALDLAVQAAKAVQ